MSNSFDVSSALYFRKKSSEENYFQIKNGTCTITIVKKPKIKPLLECEGLDLLVLKGFLYCRSCLFN